MSWSAPLSIANSVTLTSGAPVTPPADVSYILSDYIAWLSFVVDTGGITGPFSLVIQGSVDDVNWYNLATTEYDFPYPAPVTAGTTGSPIPVEIKTPVRYLRVSGASGLIVSAYYAVPEER